jgi:hypothetical protein
MKNLFLLIVTVLSFQISRADEVDDPNSVINAHPIWDGTTIFRVDTRDNTVSMANASFRFNSTNEARAIATDRGTLFRTLPKNKVRGELDRDGASVSWYFYWSPYRYYYPSYCWYGNYYYPYYSYNNSYYNYYYYGYPGRYWW